MIKLITIVTSMIGFCVFSFVNINPAVAGNLVCTDDEKANFECFESKGYTVKIVKDEFGLFPAIDTNGNSVFKYEIDCPPPKIKDVLALFPVCEPSPEFFIIKAASSTGGGFQYYERGEGDISCTRFGTAQTFKRTFEWEDFYSHEGFVSVTVEGERSAAPGPLLLQRAGCGSVHKWAFGEILLPACKNRFVGALSASECVNIDDNKDFPISASFLVNSSSGLPEVGSLRFYRELNCLGDASLPDKITQNPDGLVYCSGGPGSKNTCILLRADSPGCVDYYVSGILYQFCY